MVSDQQYLLLLLLLLLHLKNTSLVTVKIPRVKNKKMLERLDVVLGKNAAPSGARSFFL